jgi:hypothetical protein
VGLGRHRNPRDREAFLAAASSAWDPAALMIDIAIPVVKPMSDCALTEVSDCPHDLAW